MKAMIRLDIWPGWSESSLPHTHFVSHVMGHIVNVGDHSAFIPLSANRFHLMI